VVIPSTSITNLAAHPQLWRANQAAHPIKVLSSGHLVLDDVLPGNGWQMGAVTEVITNTAGCGELSLLLPLLARLSQKNQWIVMIDPPWIPNPSALHGRGLALEKLLLVRTQSRAESLWACEQVARGMSGGAMLAWPQNISFSEVRRLQLAAANTQKTVFLFLGKEAAKVSSPATLRLQLAADDGDLQVKVLKCRGRRPASAIRIRRPNLLQPLIPPLVNSSGSSNRSSSSSESSVFSLATSRIGRPSL
jgi:protein ImuA